MEALLHSTGDMFASPFMRHALLAALFASIACGITGTLVIQNRLTFLAGGAAHAAYGGIGLAFYFALPVLPCTVFFALAASLLMGALSLRGTDNSRVESPDTAIGVLWSAGMAFGIILIELTPGYAGELMGFLFGSILTVPKGDLLLMGLFDLALPLLLLIFRQGVWALSLDREFARTRGLPVNALYLLLVGITAVTVVLLIRIVGLILVLALLTIPPALARRHCQSLFSRMALASLLAFLFCLGGLILSWHTDISSGAAIIAVAALCYIPAEYGRKKGRTNGTAPAASGRNG